MPLDGVERRLSAILSADVVGYSRLIAEDEDATVRRLAAYREEIGLLVGQHGGRVVDFTGDNYLAEFPSAVNGTRCGLEIQAVLKARNASLAEDQRMEFRMGIHLGEVRVEEERIFGDGVNIAARLEALAEAGGLCISGAVWEQVKTKLGSSYEDMGEQSVKNIPDPVRVFRVRDEAPAPTRVAGEGSKERPSIVVLPFANLSADPEQEYFCDGMAEEVINALTQLEDLHVVARTSAFSFKGRDLDVRKIGRELGVQFVLEGSVRKAGNRLRITAQLINVADGYHLWSERFDRELDDVFAIQDEISASIVDTLKARLAIGSISPKTTKPTSDQEAYLDYLQGLHHFYLWTEPGFIAAVDCFEQAITRDPGFAAAHAFVAMSYTFRRFLWAALSAEEAILDAESAANRAVELGSSLGEAHNALATVRAWLLWNWQGAEREYERAIQLNPGNALAHVNYGSCYLSPVGRTSESVQEVRRGQELDPLSVPINRTLGEALFWDRQYDEAIGQLQLAVEMAADSFLNRSSLAMVYGSRGMAEQERLELRENYLRAGRKEEAQALDAAWERGGEEGMLRWRIERSLAKAEEAKIEGGGGRRAISMALLYARLAETEEALSWLEEAVRKRSGPVVYAKVHPWFDSLRSDPRFGEILKMMGLAD